MTLRDSLVAALEAENEVLRGRVADLEEALGMRMDVPVEFGLTPHEARLFGFLLKVERASKARLMSALYFERIDAEPELKIIDVYVCKLRKKLKPYDIEISTLWGQGYYITPAAKARAREILAAAASKAGE